ncbi:unnamed protein product [Dibothriocephalus latus]|uniref:Uncharacterized protein n=1 Tax=Dibothriocephalus latus TaxID=60516 RepID=A0A3P6TUJ4_DIBLA|nr:unnamed protein product [Dibothriocephalus latus]
MFNKVLSRDKLLVGLNSRPASRFWRQRIRLQLTPYVAPLETQHPELVNIYNISPNTSLFRTERRVDELGTSSETLDSTPLTRTLPIRALSEVFVSTCMRARVSEYEISLDDSDFFRQKSSGLIVCKGTGSSVWYYNTNRVTSWLVRSLLTLAEKELAASGGHPELHQQQQQQSKESLVGYRAYHGAEREITITDRVASVQIKL